MISYLAGFFDGEGCVSIGNNGSIQLRVINTSKKVLDQFPIYLGGTVLPRKQIVNKPQYHWSVYGENAVIAAIALSKHCIDKTPQLLTVIEWWDYRDNLCLTEGKKRGVSRCNMKRNAAIKEYQEKLTIMKKEFN